MEGEILSAAVSVNPPRVFTFTTVHRSVEPKRVLAYSCHANGSFRDALSERTRKNFGASSRHSATGNEAIFDFFHISIRVYYIRR